MLEELPSPSVFHFPTFLFLSSPAPSLVAISTALISSHHTWTGEFVEHTYNTKSVYREKGILEDNLLIHVSTDVAHIVKEGHLYGIYVSTEKLCK